MRNTLKGWIVGLAFACGTVGAQAEDIRMQGAGSTFVAPIMQRWAGEYQMIHPTVKIEYQAIGSGGGIKGITDKTVDFGASDAPLTKKELEKIGVPVVQIPVIAGAVVCAYNLPGVDHLKLDGQTICDIFQGKITKWNDAKIAGMNAGVNLPDAAITPVHRTDGSGTTYIFTNYLATQSSDFKEKVGAAKQVEWPGGQGGKGSEGVTQVVQTTPGAISYVELAYAKQNKLTYAEVKNKDGNFVKATPETTAKAGDAAALQMKESLVVPLWNQPGADVYPICGLVYGIVYRGLDNVKTAEKAAILVDFLTYITHDGQKIAPQLDYAPLNDAIQAKVTATLKTLEFQGKAVADAK